MKNKIINNIKKFRLFYILIVMIFTLCASVYKPIEVEAALVNQGGGSVVGNVGYLNISSERIVSTLIPLFGNNNRYISQMTMSDKKGSGAKFAMCIDYNRNVYAGDKYKITGVVTNTYIKKAYNYVQMHVYDTAGSKYSTALDKKIFKLGAQVIAWYVGLNDGAYSDSGVRPYLESALGALYDDLPGEEKTSNFYKNRTSFISLYANALIDDFSKTSSAATVYLWESICNPNAQRIISAYSGKSCTGDDCKCDVTPGGGGGKPCNSDPTISLAGECEGVSAYTDITDWSCVVKNYNQFHDSETLTSTQEGFNYCTFFCTENVQTDFPVDEYTFKAGQYFTIGTSKAGNTWGPLTVFGNRTCRSYYKSGSTYKSGVNWSKFETDMNSYNSQIKSAYNNWKYALALQEAMDISYSKRENESHKCPVYYTEWKDGCEGKGWYWDGFCWYTNGAGINVKNGTPRCPSGYSSDGYGGCTKSIFSHYETWYPSASGGGSHIKNSEGHSVTASVGTACGSRGDSGVGSAYTKYSNLVSARQARIDTMNFCANPYNNYDLSPTITFNYNSEVYSYSGKLTSSVVYQWSDNSTINSGATTGIYNKLNCGDYASGTCSTEKPEIYNAKNVTLREINNYKNVGYFLNNTNYRYALKTSGLVVGQLSDPLKTDGNYIDLQDNVIPLSYTMPVGKYNLDITYTKMGHKGYFDEYVTKIGNNPTSYRCHFNLKNDILCKDCGAGEAPAGLDVIYRPIQLGSQEVAFPSMDGDGRNPGANWIGTTASGQSYVDAYITNNRGVADYEVYNLKPLYTITMTPSLAKKIREYNKTVGDYSDFNLSCKDGRECYSKFIHTGDFESYIGGLCGDAKQSQFNTCITTGGGK